MRVCGLCHAIDDAVGSQHARLRGIEGEEDEEMQDAEPATRHAHEMGRFGTCVCAAFRRAEKDTPCCSLVYLFMFCFS